MDSAEIERLRGLLAAATPGEWSAQRGPTHAMGVYGYDAARPATVLVAPPVFEADAHLIAAAVNALPGLLDEVERLREQVAAITETVTSALDVDPDDSDPDWLGRRVLSVVRLWHEDEAAARYAKAEVEALRARVIAAGVSVHKAEARGRDFGIALAVEHLRERAEGEDPDAASALTEAADALEGVTRG